uniref:Uncharacterized protein n=1 Tax=Ralstonia solanacearum TaxID=305 RepID=A0A0S4TSF8_RALSL|nr:protein of unknown function [Ralstonia solanacearum]
MQIKAKKLRHCATPAAIEFAGWTRHSASVRLPTTSGKLHVDPNRAKPRPACRAGRRTTTRRTRCTSASRGKRGRTRRALPRPRRR